LLPLEVVLSRHLNEYIFELWPYDGKTQVTISGIKIVQIVASFQHAPQAELLNLIYEWIDEDALAVVGDDLKIHVNPCGDWEVGGFDADAGLTGRKLAVDNYGPRIPVGGGAFSGKDPSKVDRSAAYMARKIAIDYLKERQAHEVFVRLAYAIGVVEPLEVTVIVDGVAEKGVGYDVTPNGIIDSLDLRRPIYEQTARYGHFGHRFDWEK
jgi:S-adenosylmethionine synthetase